MAVDGEKLRNLRTAKGISQEKLAALSNVNKRTIQRAERGDPIALETAAFIADAVGVAPAVLRNPQSELFEKLEKGWDEVILVPTISGRKIIDLLRTSFEAEITVDVEPTAGNIGLLRDVTELLERFKPNPWKDVFDPSPSVNAYVLEAQAELNGLLPKLSDIAVRAFAATYHSRKQIPRIDGDTLEFYTSDRTPFSIVPMGLVCFSDTGETHLVRKPSDLYSDEIPF